MFYYIQAIQTCPPFNSTFYSPVLSKCLLLLISPALFLVLYLPFEEVEIIELDGASQRALWVLQLLWIHVICDCTKTDCYSTLEWDRLS